MKEFKVTAIEIHTKKVTHKVYADTPEEAEAKVRDANNITRSHTSIEQRPTSVEVKSIESIKDTGRF